MRAIRLLFAAALLTGTWIGVSAADELKVLSAEAMKPALLELAPAFEAASKHKLVIAFASDADVEKAVAEDDSIDVAILTKPRIDKLVRSARILTFPKVLAQGASEDQVYVVGSSMATEQPLAVRALMDFLAGPEAKKVYAAKGLKTS
jgi:ABC-type molybdate transport system substrate-binding protein